MLWILVNSINLVNHAYTYYTVIIHVVTLGKKDIKFSLQRRAANHASAESFLWAMETTLVQSYILGMSFFLPLFFPSSYIFYLLVWKISIAVYILFKQ